MKISMQNTSVMAFYQEIRNFPRREQELLRVLHLIQPACDRDIARALVWEIGQVNGRRNSLMQKGIVEEDHKARNPLTGKTVIYWKIKVPVQEELPF